MRGVLLSCSLLAAGAGAAPPAGVEPAPFRLDAALAGRGFTYNTESFLHRWSYRLDFPLVGSGELWDTGLWAGAGSVRSTEFYVQTLLHERIALEDWGTLELRYARDEDLDGRYERMLVGVGWRFAEGWTATLLGDVPGDKERIDAQLELAWSEGDDRFRLALVLTDFQYDLKQDLAEYEAEPVTLFAERWWRLGARTELYAFANANLEARWHDLATDQRLRDRATSAGLGLRRALGADRALRAFLRGSTLDRDRSDPGSATELDREHLELGVQYERPFQDRPSWAGIRALRFDEDEASTAAPPLRVERRELLVYGGSRWRLGERTTFAPELELNLLDIFDGNQAPGAQTAHGVESKLTLPIEVVLDAKRDARLVFRPGIELHALGFGGAQLVLSVPL